MVPDALEMFLALLVAEYTYLHGLLRRAYSDEPDPKAAVELPQIMQDLLLYLQQQFAQLAVIRGAPYLPVALAAVPTLVEQLISQKPAARATLS